MKRYFIFLLLVAVLSACAAPATETVTLPQVVQPTATTMVVEESVVPTEEVAATEAVLSPAVSTPLPNEINAPLIDAPSIVNIEMLDEIYGWAVTEQNIIRTNDGGVTWYNVTPPNLVDAGYFVFAEFFDVNHAWVQSPDMNLYPNGGTLYRTTDGGLTWETFSTPFSGGSFHFVDENNGWMMADLGVGAGSMAVSVFITNDGGKTWNRTYTNDPNIEGAAETLPLGGIKNMIVPLDADTAWVGGVVYAPGQTYLFRTDDGGKTWFNINLVLPPNTDQSELSVLAIKFLSPTEGLLAMRVTSDAPQVVVYRTSDGGNTWAQLPVNFTGYGILEAPSASEMIFYTADQFYVTNDAGATVNQVSPSIKFGEFVIDMSFANTQTGWLITASPSNERTLYKTTDGGANWTPLIP